MTLTFDQVPANHPALSMTALVIPAIYRFQTDSRALANEPVDVADFVRLVLAAQAKEPSLSPVKAWDRVRAAAFNVPEEFNR